MKLTETTLTILKAFSTINPSAVFKQGNRIRTRHPNGTVVATATLEESFPVDFAIYDLSRFIGAASLLGSPELEFAKNRVIIRGEDGSGINYGFCNPELLIDMGYNKQYPIDNVLAEIPLPAATLQKIRQASQILNTDSIKIVGEAGNPIILRAVSEKSPDSDTFTLEFGEAQNSFVAHGKIDQFKVLPDDYTLTISDEVVASMQGPRITYTLAFDIEVS